LDVPRLLPSPHEPCRLLPVRSPDGSIPAQPRDDGVQVGGDLQQHGESVE